MKAYCRSCNNVTRHREKGVRERVLVCNKCDATNMPIVLIKSNGETHYGTQCKFVEWSGEELGSKAKQMHDEPQIGYSVILDAHFLSFTWLTTPITEILNIGIGKECTTYQFKTKNSEYTLHIAKNGES